MRSWSLRNAALISFLELNKCSESLSTRIQPLLRSTSARRNMRHIVERCDKHARAD
ncbi:hypothetical protein SISNIDRAFT_33922 [Sistotremastrum niveocremeum HHB9708]|uniref:Uncharacterized protein n=2 Tax=Sistotremastraceae TaxID=3402574 RepID=A0A164W9E5_9AGAM|nr:hypothetical protein SISNIDRAFT_33922 [Sistotremastrum niveocremeum HHB9708]KZT36854.1 hypothetical protein SISSUDRAFT_916406 [Sistotremastrum suecicum HHB10207 ss-3]